jgi:zinc protease
MSDVAMRMKFFVALPLLLSIAAVSSAQEPAKSEKRKLIPYDYYIDDLPNDLRLVTIPTDYPNLVAFYIVVAPARGMKSEPGKTGYAHFFEHMMFRGSENYPPGSAMKSCNAPALRRTPTRPTIAPSITRRSRRRICRRS